MRRRPLTLSATLSLYMGGGLFSLALAFGIAMQLSMSRILEDALHDKSRALAHQLALVTLDAMLVHDYGTLERYLRDIARETGVEYIRIRREDGEVLGEVGTAVPDRGEGSRVTVAYPVMLTERPVGEVTVSYSGQPVQDAILSLSLIGLAGTATVSLLLFIVLRQVIERRLVRPVQGLASQFRPAGTYPRPAPDSLPVELARIARTFADLGDAIARHDKERDAYQQLALAATHKLCHDQRMVMAGQMVAGLAHALNTPLGNILGYAQQAQRMSRDPAIQQPLEVIERQARSCAATVKQMLSGAHTPQPQIRPIDLSDAVRQCVRLVMPVLHDTGIRTLDVSGCAPCPVLADPSLIEQVLFNLLSNAADAGAANLRLRLICGGQNGALEIEDDGEGFPPQILPLLFQPFVTGKSPGRGTGLGLYLCRSLLRSMGGEIDLVSTHPGATVLRITLSRPAGPTACGVHAGDELPCTDR